MRNYVKKNKKKQTSQLLILMCPRLHNTFFYVEAWQCECMHRGARSKVIYSAKVREEALFHEVMCRTLRTDNVNRDQRGERPPAYLLQTRGRGVDTPRQVQMPEMLAFGLVWFATIRHPYFNLNKELYSLCHPT